jgi:hypothetical protein
MGSVESFIPLALREQCYPLMNDDPHDRAVLDLFIRFMNTFMREAINRNNPKALYTLFYQYTSLAKDLSKWCSDLLIRVTKYILVSNRYPNLGCMIIFINYAF